MAQITRKFVGGTVQSVIVAQDYELSTMGAPENPETLLEIVQTAGNIVTVLGYYYWSGSAWTLIGNSAPTQAQFTNTPSGGVAILGPDGVTPIWFFDAIDPRSNGAKCDGKMVLDATTTASATCTVTSSTASFSAADIGKICAVLPTSTTGPWSAKQGTITAYNPATGAITATLGGSPGALINAQFVWGTNDTAAWTTAATAAGNQKRPLFVPVGISCVQNFTLPDRIAMFGLGADRTITWPWTSAGYNSAIVCAKWPGADATAVIKTGYGNSLSNFMLDAFQTGGIAIDNLTNQGHGTIEGCTIARGYNYGLQTGAAQSVKNCTIWGQDCAQDLVVLSGDNRLSDCDIYGAGTNGAAVSAPGHDTVIANNHFWKNATSQPNGPSVKLSPYAASGLTGSQHVIGNTFDTSMGPHVQVTVVAGQTARNIKISNNSAFQNNNVPDATYPYIDLNVAGTLLGLSVMGNTGEASFADPAQANYTAFIDGVGITGTVAGSTVMGNVITGCAAGYATFTPDHSTGNYYIAGSGSVATAF